MQRYPLLLVEAGGSERRVKRKRKKEKVFSFFLFSFFPFFLRFWVVCPGGGETEAFWFFLHGVPDSINVVPQPRI